MYVIINSSNVFAPGLSVTLQSNTKALRKGILKSSRICLLCSVYNNFRPETDIDFYFFQPSVLVRCHEHKLIQASQHVPRSVFTNTSILNSFVCQT
jgi:hypothetical protein